MSETVFSTELHQQIIGRFRNVTSDPISGERIYFENAGGTLKLNAIFPVLDLYTSLPDNAGRRNKSSQKTMEAIARGREAGATTETERIVALRALLAITSASALGAPPAPGPWMSEEQGDNDFHWCQGYHRIRGIQWTEKRLSRLL